MKRVSAHARTRQGDGERGKGKGATYTLYNTHTYMNLLAGLSLSQGCFCLFVTFVHFTVPFRLIKFCRFCDLLQSLCVYLIFITLVVIS